MLSRSTKSLRRFRARVGAAADHSYPVHGFLLTVRLGLLQVRHLGKAFRFMVKNEEEGHGEVTSFGALCAALSATIGTGNIAGVATALAAGGPGALFWMIVAAFLGMATKYAEGLLAIKYRTVDKDGHILGGPFYYIKNGMEKRTEMAGEDLRVLRRVRRPLRHRNIYPGQQYRVSGNELL